MHSQSITSVVASHTQVLSHIHLNTKRVTEFANKFKICYIRDFQESYLVLRSKVLFNNSKFDP